MIRLARTYCVVPLLLMAFGGSSIGAAEVGPLTVVTERTVDQEDRPDVYFEHFTAATGINVRFRSRKEIVTDLRKQVDTGMVRWDVVNLSALNGRQACVEGLLEPFDASRLAPGPNGTPAERDFAQAALTGCTVADVADATVVAFNSDRYASDRPSSIDALFDIERFPGVRALQPEPIPLLFWALRAYGVPWQEIYSLLGTTRGIDLAFARLDRIKEHIIWLENTKSALDLLASGEIAMASGRIHLFLNASTNGNAPIQILGATQLYDYSTWGVPRGAPHPKAAFEFVRLVSRFDAGIVQATRSGSIPATTSTPALLGQNTPSVLSVGPHLSSYLTTINVVIPRSHEWVARTRQYIHERFKTWQERQGNRDKFPE